MKPGYLQILFKFKGVARLSSILCGLFMFVIIIIKKIKTSARF